MSPDRAIRIRPLEERDFVEANRILRVAFGTFQGEDPTRLFPGRESISTRWRANPGCALAAEVDGRLIATNIAANWGSFGYFGPLTVLPEYWDQKVAQALLEPTMGLFDRWNIAHRGLFTFPQSPKHIHLYEKFGFRAGHLTAIFRKAVSERPQVTFEKLSTLSKDGQKASIEACGALTGELLEGLDLRVEIHAVLSQGLGDVCLIHEGATLAGFAVCHLGAGTDAGDGACYVKFGAALPSANAEHSFRRLVEAAEALATDTGLGYVTLGVNMGRRRAYDRISQSGYRTEILGVAMETHPERSTHRPDVYLIDDWR